MDQDAAQARIHRTERRCLTLHIAVWLSPWPASGQASARLSTGVFHSNDIKLQEASRSRLAAVERIAKEWKARAKAPLSSVSKEPLICGRSVFDMLAADTINEAAVIGAFDELMGRIQEKPKSRSQRLRDAGFSRRPSVRSLPSDE